jgi:hypothetical protein
MRKIRLFCPKKEAPSIIGNRLSQQLEVDRLDEMQIYLLVYDWMLNFLYDVGGG